VSAELESAAGLGDTEELDIERGELEPTAG
jgi:hypothetical protein